MNNKNRVFYCLTDGSIEYHLHNTASEAIEDAKRLIADRDRLNILGIKVYLYNNSTLNSQDRLVWNKTHKSLSLIYELT